jgi:hypothetical protein
MSCAIICEERLSILSIVDLVVWTSISTGTVESLMRGKIIFQNKNWFCLCKKSFYRSKKVTAVLGLMK